MPQNDKALLARLKELLVLNWRQKSSARSQIKLAIEDALDAGLPRAYEKPLYEKKCAALFEHMFESYGNSATAPGAYQAG